MDLTGISSTDPVFGTTANLPSSQLDKNAFMKLLVTQMQNQDPLSPADSTQYVSQLAQFSSLEQMQNLNDDLVGMATLQQNNALLSQLTESSALIGKTVQWTDANSGAQSSGQVTAVKIQNGAALLEVNGQDVPLSSVSMVDAPPNDTGSGGSGGS